MSLLKLPDGEECGFRLVSTDAWGGKFTMNLYGRGRWGWFLANQRGFLGRGERAVGPQRLLKGQWRTFLNFVNQCRFWELPEYWEPPEARRWTVDDGSWLEVTGRRGSEYHRIHRFVWRERGLDQLETYAHQISTLFPRRAVSLEAVQVAPAAIAETVIPPNPNPALEPTGTPE
jgi:hypothetical protein